ncbi:MAG: SCP2 sterol-binding domain-containing protein [Benniella sp.]|nr:MAG: SCP2 sterol-binding domain-containing protein [Benniella sp.]
MAFQSEDIFARLNEALDMFDSKERQELVKQVNGVFEFHIKKDADVKIWYAEVKNQGVIKAGPAPGNPDITLFLTDDDMVALAVGDLSGARAFITERIGLKGPMMMAMKLDVIFRTLGMGPPKGAADDLAYDGFESSYLIMQISEYLKVLSDDERKAEVAKVKGVFLFNVKNGKGETAVWMMDMKHGIGQMKKGKIEGLKPDIVLEMKDKDFVDLFMGKTNGQKAFMTGKIKVKGAIMLALKLDTMMKDTQEKIGFFGQKQAKL